MQSFIVLASLAFQFIARGWGGGGGGGGGEMTPFSQLRFTKTP